MAVYTFETLKDDYAACWDNMEINPGKLTAVRAAAAKILAGRAKYEELEKKTNVPWYFIGLVHLRESNCNFARHLHNGDPLTARTRHVPANRPIKGQAPFTFEESSIDALTLMGYTKITNWSIERIAFSFEKYNGFGYRARGVNSPYLWASSNQYVKGKFISDGAAGWRPNVVDVQLGAMTVLKELLNQVSVAPVVVPISAPPIPTPVVEKPLSPAAELDRPTNQQMSEVSRKFRITDYLRWLLGIPPAAKISVEVLNASNIQATRSYIDTAKSFIDAYGALLFFGFCLAAFLAVFLLRKYMKDDVQAGRNIPSGEVDKDDGLI